MAQTKKKLLILGSGGLLGSELLGSCYLSSWNVVGHGRTFAHEFRADLSKESEAMRMLELVSPDAIINLVALTNVDYCESFPGHAYISNVKTLENVVSWVKSAGKFVRLVHISTDQVYDGVGPHKEASVMLSNYYAFSKYASELVAQSVSGTVLRTNFFGKSKCCKRTSFTDWIYSSLTGNMHINVYDDIKFSPVSMSTLSKMISLILNASVSGVYNVGSRDGLSKADFAYQFAETLQLDSSLMTRCSVADVDLLKTYRPKDMRLDVGSFEQDLGVRLPILVQEIEKVAKDYLK